MSISCVAFARITDELMSKWANVLMSKWANVQMSKWANEQTRVARFRIQADVDDSVKEEE